MDDLAMLHRSHGASLLCVPRPSAEEDPWCGAAEGPQRIAAVAAAEGHWLHEATAGGDEWRKLAWYAAQGEESRRSQSRLTSRAPVGVAPPPTPTRAAREARRTAGGRGERGVSRGGSAWGPVAGRAGSEESSKLPNEPTYAADMRHQNCH
eukprot:scaffold66956_cov63-Phaeocystis_antarctica.AAC.2